MRAWALKTKATGQPIDLTGATATLTVRNSKKELIYTASTTNGDMAIDGLRGMTSMEIDETVTAVWLPGTYTFKFRLTHAGGQEKTYEATPLVVLD